MQSERVPRRTLALLAVGAVGVRLVYLAAFAGDYKPRSDANHYQAIASAFANGDGISARFPFTYLPPTAFRPPPSIHRTYERSMVEPSNGIGTLNEARPFASVRMTVDGAGVPPADGKGAAIEAERPAGHRERQRRLVARAEPLEHGEK